MKEFGPEYGSNTNLIVKNEHLDFAELAFSGSCIKILVEAHKYTVNPISGKNFFEQHVLKTLDGWISKLES